MPITVDDYWYGAKLTDTGDRGTIENEYIIGGTDDEFAAGVAFTSALASSLGDYVLEESRIVERLSQFEWKGYARWGSFEPIEPAAAPGGPSTKFEFDTSGGLATIFNSKGTTRYAAAGKTAPDFKNAINVTEQGPQGLQVQVPAFSWQETHYLDYAYVSSAYIATLFALTGTENSAPFRNYATGESFFLGARGALARHDYWELTYRFAASPNASGLAVGDITGIDKRGWQYLWVKYRKAEDSAAKAMGAEPIGVYVEDVHETADHNLLGI